MDDVANVSPGASRRRRHNSHEVARFAGTVIRFLIFLGWNLIVTTFFIGGVRRFGDWPATCRTCSSFRPWTWNCAGNSGRPSVHRRQSGWIGGYWFVCGWTHEDSHPLCWQPQWNVCYELRSKSGRNVLVESALRWKTRDRKSIPGNYYVDMVELLNFIVYRWNVLWSKFLSDYRSTAPNDRVLYFVGSWK